MTEEQIREIVRITVEEIINKKMVKLDVYDYVLDFVGTQLTDYFDNSNNIKIENALKLISDDYYINIIYLQYRDKKTIEWIAEYFNKDTSTILRNKKRLIYKIYEEVKRWD